MTVRSCVPYIYSTKVLKSDVNNATHYGTFKGEWAAKVSGKYKDTTIILRKMFNLYIHVDAFK